MHTVMLWELVATLADRGVRVGWCIHESELPVLYRALPGVERALTDGLLERVACVFVCDAQRAEYAPLRPAVMRCL